MRGMHFGPRPALRRARERLAALRFERIEVRPLAPTIGAEISGADLADLDDETFAEVERALVEYKAIFFRRQPLTVEQQLAFAQRFGELEEHPFLPARDGYGEVIRFAKDEQTPGLENAWHSDVSWREIPPMGTVLRAIDVPEVGGDTLFAGMEVAWESLPEDVRERVRGWEAIHDFTQSFGRSLQPEQLAERQEQFPAVRHPVVRTHPVSGRESIYVNGIFTREICGLEPEESEKWIRYLTAQAAFPELQCRWRWEPDSVAMWDNRSAQHYAANDYWPERRVMERATIVGDKPI